MKTFKNISKHVFLLFSLSFPFFSWANEGALDEKLSLQSISDNESVSLIEPYDDNCCPSMCIDDDLLCDCCLPTLDFCLSSFNLSYFSLRGEGTFGRTYGVTKSYGTLGLFSSVPFYDGAVFSCMDLRGHYFEKNCYAFNTGLGLRYRDCFIDRIWGAHVYWDYRRACHNDFNQIGASIESLGRYVDIRFNGYFPTSTQKRTCHKKVFDQYSGNYVAICREWAAASRGLDGDFGVSLFRCYGLLAYPAVGFYYYYPSEKTNVWGFRGRFRLSWRELVSLEYRYTYDRIFKSCSQGIISVNVPFDLLLNCYCQTPCYNVTWVDQQYATPPSRQPIVALTSCNKWTTNY